MTYQGSVTHLFLALEIPISKVHGFCFALCCFVLEWAVTDFSQQFHKSMTKWEVKTYLGHFHRSWVYLVPSCLQGLQWGLHWINFLQVCLVNKAWNQLSYSKVPAIGNELSLLPLTFSYHLLISMHFHRFVKSFFISGEKKILKYSETCVAWWGNKANERTQSWCPLALLIVKLLC